MRNWSLASELATALHTGFDNVYVMSVTLFAGSRRHTSKSQEHVPTVRSWASTQRWLTASGVSDNNACGSPPCAWHCPQQLPQCAVDATVSLACACIVPGAAYADTVSGELRAPHARSWRSDDARDGGGDQ